MAALGICPPQGRGPCKIHFDWTRPHIGEGHRTKPLIWQIIHKSIAFLILVAGLTVIEEAIVGFLHGKTFWESMAEVGGGTTEEMIATALVMFLCSFRFLPTALSWR